MCKHYEMAKNYEPSEIEQKWYQWWLDQNLFVADDQSEAPAFSIVLPPPNVTGALHIGHAYDHSLQDIIVRYKRAKGLNVLWLPGTDHAGIATQNVVEKNLAKQGITRHQLGREAFVQKVWEWKEEYGSRIVNQMKRLGDSCDWSRQRFTMDEGLSQAVREVFVKLYKKGLIYKGKYIVNWCPRCHTALSDIEVEHKEEQGALYHVRYPYADGQGYIVVATSRPETIPADTAVAVNPDDETKKNLIGKEVIVPLTNGRKVPLIADSMVEIGFGSGFVKITPAHDPNDFLAGKRHNLSAIQIIDEHGIMTEEAGPELKGKTVADARKRSVELLEAEGLLDHIEELPHQVGHCYRCDTVVEPYLSDQWFVKVSPLAQRGVESSQKGDIRWIPEQWDKTYYRWMDGVRDWCISRQLWWGHRIPAWTCSDCGHLIVEAQDPTTCPCCQSTNLIQDEDVLDTWFSSALWPFSTMGWPEETSLFKKFYPTSTLVTGFDIIFFWVSRMIMMGLEFTDKAPFNDVFIHSLVRDEQGRKMSKSLGNGIDPIDMIEKFGADALRFTLASLTIQGRDILIGESRIETNKFFMNKIWNASRFALSHLQGESCSEQLNNENLRVWDQWLLERLDQVIANSSPLMDRYDLGEVARQLYEFTWGDLCDWYIELAKPALYGDEGKERQQETKKILFKVFKDLFRLLHPFIPFLTEELWHGFGYGDCPVELEGWPEIEGYNFGVLPQMEHLQELIRGIRNLRAEAGISPSTKLQRVLFCTTDEIQQFMTNNMDAIQNLARIETMEFIESGQVASSLMLIVSTGQLFLPVGDLLDVDAEIARLQKEMKSIEANLAKSRNKLSSESFVAKAPADVVEKERARLLESEEKLSRLKANIASLSGVNQ